MGKEVLYSAIVNQKLAFARVALNAAAEAAEDDINSKLTRHAQLDAAVAQLCSALSFFIAEVAEQYSLSLDPALKEPNSLLEEFAGQGRQSAEISELNTLRKQGSSWFAELLQARANPLYLAERFKAPDTGDNFIPLLDLTRARDGEQGPLDLVRHWGRSAQALVDRQRANLHEE